MAQKLMYIFLISRLLEICTSNISSSFTCSKKDKAAILLDTATDFITRAKYTNPTCSYDVYNVIRRENSASILETATNLISAAKKACDGPPQTSAKASDATVKYKVFCIFETFSYNWKGDTKFEISHINPYLCTHILYFSAKLHNNQIESLNPEFDLDGPGRVGGYKMFNTLKHKNPNLKTLLVVRGSDTGADQFSSVAADKTNRTTFVSSVVLFLKKYGFDGLHVWWLFPNEKQNFLLLLQDLKASLSPQDLLLTAYAHNNKIGINDGYDIPAFSKELDLIYLLNFHSSDSTKTFVTSPLYGSEENEDTHFYIYNTTVNYWLKGGAPKEKLIMGLWLHGISFTLADTTQHGIRAPSTGPGRKGPFFDKVGTLGFNIICLRLAKESWNSVYDWESRTFYAYKGDQWVSYDDIYSINQKIDYIIEKGLAGISLPIYNDDFRGNCYGRKYPILNTVASRLLPECNGKDISSNRKDISCSGKGRSCNGKDISCNGKD